MKLIDLFRNPFQNRHFFAYVDYEWRRLRQDGLSRFIWKLAKKLAVAGLAILFLPISIALHLAGFRRLTVFTDRIGHLAIEPDCLLKDCELGLLPRRRWFILAPPKRVANEHLLKYWEQHIPVVKNQVGCFLLDCISHFGLVKFNVSHYILAFNETHAAYPINTLWGERSPLLNLSVPDKQWLKEMLHEVGVPNNTWYACVHVRDAGFSSVDESLHSHRNANLLSTIPAIHEITQRGGWVLRIGDSSSQPLPSIDQVIDYAHHPLKSPRLDVAICANARFILGNTSGLALVGSVFGVPCALVNMIPMSTLGLLSSDISIPKLCWSIAEKRYLNFNEIMDSPISNYRYAPLFSKNGIRVDENSEEDIRDLVVEMLDRLDGQFFETEDDRKLQQHYLSLFHPGHYSYGAASHVGTMFLRRHRSLLATTNDIHTQSKSGGINTGPVMIT